MVGPAGIRKEHKEIYWAWKAMKQRCQNPRCSAYRNYGARGISVCNAWQDFEPFHDWAIGNGYEKGLDLDRIDNDAGYSPENCRWVSRRENINNRRMTTLLTVKGQRRPRTEWADLTGIPPATIKRWVLNHGKEYAQDRIAEVFDSGYSVRDYGFSHRKAVFLVETGEVFGSVREAGASVGYAPCTISNAIRNGRKTGKGTFQFL